MGDFSLVGRRAGGDKEFLVELLKEAFIFWVLESSFLMEMFLGEYGLEKLWILNWAMFY